MIEVLGVTFWVPGLVITAMAVAVVVYLKIKGE
jgi:hypothetical protein